MAFCGWKPLSCWGDEPPVPNYETPVPNYETPVPNYGAPVPNYGAPVPNYRRLVFCFNLLWKWFLKLRYSHSWEMGGNQWQSRKKTQFALELECFRFFTHHAHLEQNNCTGNCDRLMTTSTRCGNSSGRVLPQVF